MSGTDPGRLCCLCSAHHKALHRGWLLVEGDASAALTFKHADGTPYGAAVDPAEAKVRADVASALCRLGARHDEAQAAVAAAATHVGRDVGFERLMKESLGALRSPAPAAGPPPARHRMLEDAESALRNLGCKRGIARSVVDTAAAHVGADATLEELIKKALSLLRPGGTADRA